MKFPIGIALCLGPLAIVAVPAVAFAHGIHPAPGPIVGAGLPVLAVGYGVYWLIRRRKTK